MSTGRPAATTQLLRVAALAVGLLGAAAFTPASAQPYTVEGERALHPNISNAIASMQMALADLERAPDNFGGHKGAAIADLQRAILSAKRALYFRLKMDDHALMMIR